MPDELQSDHDLVFKIISETAQQVDAEAIPSK
jgi:hypothetical protein